MSEITDKEIHDPIDIKDHAALREETEELLYAIDPSYDFKIVSDIFKDIIDLFYGEFPGYRACNTNYHDLSHTLEVTLCMARLMHGYIISGKTMDSQKVVDGIISALLHDTGYIQSSDDTTGTGAKYTLTHITRSNEFAEGYLRGKGLLQTDITLIQNAILCTDTNTTPKDIDFASDENRLVGSMLGSVDLIAQMADHEYLEKIIHLFSEFKEGNITEFSSELDLLQKTIGFYEFVKGRLKKQLGGVHKYLREHFKSRWDINDDLYEKSIRRNISYLEYVIKNYEDNYREHLKQTIDYFTEENG